MWKCVDSCYYLYLDTQFDKNKSTISFDFDGTLMDFKTDEIMDITIQKVKQLSNIFNIVVFSNQMGIDRNKTTHNIVQSRFDMFLKSINVPIHIFYSTKKDKYRKPYIGMFELFKSLVNQPSIDIQWYCGDAAGRHSDFSTSDLYFAHNIGIQFKVPEEIFENCINPELACKNIKALELYKKDIWKNGLLDNHLQLLNIKNVKEKGHDININLGSKNLILLVGPPGSGKSSLSTHYSEKHNLGIISRDINPSKKYRENKFNQYMIDDKLNGIIIDDLNNTEQSRNIWINKVKYKPGWEIIIIYINIYKRESIHLCNYRFHYNEKKYIPTVVIHKYYKYLEPPNDSIVLCSSFTNYDFNHTLRFV
tara:strand:- start:2921 stop:4012 length:1092 start_codon:yes stop_codon:yes gene_type:complete